MASPFLFAGPCLPPVQEEGDVSPQPGLSSCTRQEILSLANKVEDPSLLAAAVANMDTVTLKCHGFFNNNPLMQHFFREFSDGHKIKHFIKNL